MVKKNFTEFGYLFFVFCFFNGMILSIFFNTRCRVAFIESYLPVFTTKRTDNYRNKPVVRFIPKRVI